MFSFLYTILDSILEWTGFKSVEPAKGMSDVLRESLCSHIEHDKSYIESRKKHSKYKDIHQIYDILTKDYGLKLPVFGTSLNLIDWFNEQINEYTETKQSEKKVKLLLLKVEYQKWIDITKRDNQLKLKESLLEDSITLEDFIEIMNEC